MNNTLPAILSFIFIVAGSWLLSRITCTGGTSAADAASISVLDGELNTNPFQVNFANGSSKATFSKNSITQLRKVASHLKDNSRMLNLGGLYYTSEKADDRDLGLERAEAVKAKLIELDAPGDNIITSSDLLHYSKKGVKTLFNPVSYNFSEKKTDGLGVQGSEDGTYSFVANEPYSMMFGDAKDDIEISDNLRSYIEQAKAYLENNTGSKIILTGYTDVNGSAKNNKTSSYNRTRIIRNLLVEDFGIKNILIKKIGNGYSDVGDNSTEEGRAMNRRVEITVE